jgi:hypothetical protein
MTRMMTRTMMRRPEGAARLVCPATVIARGHRSGF